MMKRTARAVFGVALLVAASGCVTKSGTPTSPSAAVSCSLTLQGSEVSVSGYRLSWAYSFTGVSSASFTSQGAPATDNRQLTTSPGFVTSNQPRHSSLDLQFTYTVTLTAGSCVRTGSFRS